MGMRNWPEYGMGLVLTSDHMIGDVDEITYLVEKAGYEDAFDLVDAKEGAGNTWRYYSENTDADGLSFHSFSDDDAADAEPSEMLVIWAKKWMKPFEGVYTPEELRSEFQDLVGDFLPEDFNWDSHIGEFSCSVYC